MEHLVTVRTYWTEVADRVHEIALPNRSDRNQMMDMDKAPTNLAIPRFKVEATDRAGGPIVVKACCAS